MERTFNIYRFQGVYQHKAKGLELKKMSLKTCLDKVFNTYWDNTTYKFFSHNGFSFDYDNLSLEELTEKIAEGLAVFPISINQDIEEVKRYIELGLDPVFMRARDFQTFRKCYGI